MLGKACASTSGPCIAALEVDRIEQLLLGPQPQSSWGLRTNQGTSKDSHHQAAMLTRAKEQCFLQQWDFLR